jgi:hypothetical protein
MKAESFTGRIAVVCINLWPGCQEFVLICLIKFHSRCSLPVEKTVETMIAGFK